MASLYVTEFIGVNEGSPISPGTTQVVSFTGTAGASTAFASNTTLVRIHTDGICSIKFGKAPTAVANTDLRMVAGATEYFAVGAGDKVSAVTST